MPLGCRIKPDQIATETAADGYKIHTLIRELILSTPFQTKTNPSAEP